MKLNNKGWGLGFLIIVGAIFLLILIVSSIKINKFIKDSKDDSKKQQNTSTDTKVDNNAIYTALELRLEDAGESYIVYHETLLDYVEDHIIVKYSTLKDEGHISSLPDPDGEVNCDGYVMIKTDFSVKPFLKCTNYKTLNYDLWVD